MDYEKKYKEALERAKRINDGDGIECPPGWTTCEVIFPELKAIEDANIRGAIIDYLKDNNLTEWAAWLEKQSEPKDRYTFNSIPRLLEMIKPTGRAKAYCQKLIDSLLQEGYATDAKIVSDCLKQMNGEQVAMATMDEKKPVEWNREDEQSLNACLGYIPDEFLRRWLMDVIHVKYDKPADKDEPKYVPKFHEGDWVIGGLTKNEPRQIAEVTEEGYKTTYGGWIGSSFEKDMRLWTIQDAKDGDVICSGQIILLFKKWEDSDWNFVIAYAGIDVSGKLQITNGHWLIANDSHPATKEQRDILFQKMDEAGYEWDAERKELCPLSKSEATSDSVTQTLVDTAKAFLQALSSTPYNNTPVVEAQFAVKQLLTFLSDPKAYDPDASNEHKSAEWSEEDEKQARQIERIVHYDGCSKKLQKQISDWLKSIKNRIQPKQEWSEEDEAMFQGVIETEQYMLDVVYGRKIFAVGNEDLKEECTKELAWLNSLRPKKQWKPSEEQLRELENVFSPDTDSWDEGVLRKLYEQLKQL